MQYEVYMKKCIELARFGEGMTSPNPLVGCIVLDKFGNEIASGFHKKYGENHAERDALLKLTQGEEEGGTLIVNLEPCSHFGKTPPCSDLIISRKITKVVIGMRDVNPIVAGNGIKKLKDAGIEIVEGVLQKECEELNEIFIKNHTQKKPFIAIKTATTLDGKIATSSGSSKWITSENARNEVKKIRNRYDTILTTSTTIITDNPSMEHKVKIILDRELKTDFNNAKIYQNGEIIVFFDKLKAKIQPLKNIKFIPCPTVNSKLDLDFVFTKIYELGYKSLLIEAGGHLNGQALNYADKIYHFIAPKITGDNLSKSCFNYRNIDKISQCENFRFVQTKMFEPDILLIYKK